MLYIKKILVFLGLVLSAYGIIQAIVIVPTLIGAYLFQVDPRSVGCWDVGINFLAKVGAVCAMLIIFWTITECICKERKG